MCGLCPERSVTISEAVSFQRYGLAIAFAHQQKIAVVGDEDETVFVPVFQNLFAVSNRGDGSFGRFDFDHAALGHLAGQRFGIGALLELALGEEAAIGQTGTRICKLINRVNLWLKRFANAIEQVDERRVIRRFSRARAGVADVGEMREVLFETVHGSLWWFFDCPR